MRWTFLAATLTILLSIPVSLQADTLRVAAEDNWAEQLNTLEPGDVAILEPGRYTASTDAKRTLRVQGTAENPITIKGSGYFASTFDGATGPAALRLIDVRHLVIENVAVTNPSPYGIDGRQHYYTENKQPTARPELAEGIIVRGAHDLTIRHSRFHDIATRGILASGGVDGLHLEHCFFIRIGDDTASGDLAVGRDARHITVRENVFAGNVDGVMFERPDGGNLVEHNIFLFHRWEDGIDFKFVGPKDQPSENPWTIVRENVIYAHRSNFSGITIQMSTDYVKVRRNVIHGHAGMHGPRDGGNAMLVRARNGDTEHVQIVGNWLNGAYSQDEAGRGIRLEFDGRNPGSTLRNVGIFHNVFSGFAVSVAAIAGAENMRFYNNILEDAPIKVDIPQVFEARTNLYGEPRPWGREDNAIMGHPVYTIHPVGPLRKSSPGYNVATPLPDIEGSPHVGLPDEEPHLVDLEEKLVRKLLSYFSAADLRDAYRQGDVTFPDPLQDAE